MKPELKSIKQNIPVVFLSLVHEWGFPANTINYSVSMKSTTKPLDAIVTSRSTAKTTFMYKLFYRIFIFSIEGRSLEM